MTNVPNNSVPHGSLALSYIQPYATSSAQNKFVTISRTTINKMLLCFLTKFVATVVQ